MVRVWRFATLQFRNNWRARGVKEEDIQAVPNAVCAELPPVELRGDDEQVWTHYLGVSFDPTLEVLPLPETDLLKRDTLQLLYIAVVTLKAASLLKIIISLNRPI